MTSKSIDKNKQKKLSQICDDKEFSDKSNNVVGKIALTWASLRKAQAVTLKNDFEIGDFEDFLIWYYDMWKEGASHEDIHNVIWL